MPKTSTIATRRRKAAPSQSGLLPVRLCSSDESVALGALVPYDRNPRGPLSDARAAEVDRSLLELGLFRPLLVWRDADGREVVVGGNRRRERLAVLVAAGHPLVGPDGDPTDQVPITRLHATQDQARIVALRDNTHDGDWDWDRLGAELSEIAASGADVKLSGIDSGLLDDLLQYAGDPEQRLRDLAARGGGGALGDGGDDGQPTTNTPGSGDGGRLVVGEVVGVNIGHVRGRVTRATYERLASALVQCGGDGAGLDVAVRALLDRAGL